METLKVIVTTKNNKGSKCLVEILNRVLIKDPSAEAKEIKKNLIAVYSSVLSSLEVYGLIYLAPPSCAQKIYPIDMVVSSNEREVITKTVELLKSRYKRGFSFYVDCIRRGGKMNCREVELGIGLGMKGYADVNFKVPDIIVVVNDLGDFSTVSIIKKGQEKLSVNSLKEK
ncbi:MAG: THUMP domain-containing protein [Sulfolobus sp.]|nr:THUMP domain-containing protein [Sulfolobus sp.]